MSGGGQWRRYTHCFNIKSTCQSVALESAEHQEGRARDTINIQGATGKNTNENRLDAPVDVEPPQERNGKEQEQEIIEDIEPGQKVMQDRPVDTTPGDGVVPVLGDGPASEDAGAQADRTVSDEPDHYGQGDAPGRRGGEDTAVLEEDGELHRELSEAVRHDGGVEGD